MDRSVTAAALLAAAHIAGLGARAQAAAPEALDLKSPASFDRLDPAWKLRLPAGPARAGRATVAGERVYALDALGALVALDLASGRVLWKTAEDGAAGGIAPWTAGGRVLFVQGVAPATMRPPSLLAADAEGRILYRVPLGGEPHSAARGLDAVAVVAVAAAKGLQLAAFSVKDGRELWRETLAEPALEVAGEGDHFYLVRGEGPQAFVERRDARSGKRAWARAVPQAHGLAAAGGRVAVMAEGSVVALDAARGTAAWTTYTPVRELVGGDGHFAFRGKTTISIVMPADGAQVGQVNAGAIPGGARMAIGARSLWLHTGPRDAPDGAAPGDPGSIVAQLALPEGRPLQAMSGAVSAPTGIAVAGGIAVFEDDDGLFALPAAVPPSPLGKLSPEMMEKLALQAALSSLERQSRESGPLPRDLLGRGPAVVVYGTQWCGACKRARAYLDETGVAYRDLDVELNAAAEDDYRVLMKKHGYSAGAVPLITVGERAMLGFSPARLRTWLREAKLLR